MDPLTWLVIVVIALIGFLVLRAVIAEHWGYSGKMDAWPSPEFQGREFRSLAVYYPVKSDLVARGTAEAALVQTLGAEGLTAVPLLQLFPPNSGATWGVAPAVLEAAGLDGYITFQVLDVGKDKHSSPRYSVSHGGGVSIPLGGGVRGYTSSSVRTYHGGTYHTPRIRIEVSLHNRIGARAWLAQASVTGGRERDHVQLLLEAAKMAVHRLREAGLLPPRRESSALNSLSPRPPRADPNLPVTAGHNVAASPQVPLPTALSTPVESSERRGKLLGSEIVAQFLVDPTKAPAWVGRGGGIGGELFRKDLEGGWRSFSYEVAWGGGCPNRNWLASSSFVGALRDAGQVP